MKNCLCFYISFLLAAAHAQAAGEIDFLEPLESARSEHTIQSTGQVLWTLPFETTQYLPEQQTAAMRNAIAAQQAGRFLEAISLIEQPGEHADLAEAQLLRASFYLQGRQFDEARDILASLQQSKPNLADAHALMAMAHLEQGRLDAASADMQKAQGQSDGPLVARISTYVLQARGELQQASDIMAALNARGPADPLNLAREAELALSLGDNRRAAVRVAEARKLAPNSPYVMAVSGLVWLIEDRPAEAQQAFVIALQRDPEDAKALLGLGLAKARQGRLEESIAHLRKATDAEPSSAMIQTYLGRALHQAGKPAEAQAAYQTAIRLDPLDPVPWIYLAQIQTESGQPGAALDSLKQAGDRRAARAVYRGENLLNEDEQTLQTNMADAYSRLGLNGMAWRALADGAGEKNAQTLKNQAEILKDQRFAETARRSLALQSLFNDGLDDLPVTLDVYGGGGGQAGASTPQHGAVAGLSGQRASYGDYGALFVQPVQVEVDAIAGNRQTWGEQVRAAAGGERFGISLAQRHYETEGFSRFNGLDNTTWQGVLKWDPTDALRVFLSYQDFQSERGEVLYPAEPWLGSNAIIDDENRVGRLGLRYRFGRGGELRALFSRQHTEQENVYQFFPPFDWITFSQPGKSHADSGEIQYRQQDARGHWLFGAQRYREHAEFFGVSDDKVRSGQVYAARKMRLGEQWTVDLGLGYAWIENDNLLSDADTELRRWTPRLGVTFMPAPSTHVRLAMGQHLGQNDVGGASLAPVETAGIVHIRPNDVNRLVRSAGLGFDHRLNVDWLISGEAQIRRAWQPVNYGAQSLEKYTQNDAQLKLGWLPATGRLSATLGAGYERRSSPEASFVLDSVQSQRLRELEFEARWPINSHLIVSGNISRNWVDGEYQAFVPYSYSDASTQINASLQWKLAQGQVEFGVRNLLDDEFEYVESDPLLPRFSQGRLVYGGVRLSW